MVLGGGSLSESLLPHVFPRHSRTFLAGIQKGRWAGFPPKTCGNDVTWLFSGRLPLPSTTLFLSTQHSALFFTQHSAPSTQHFLIGGIVIRALGIDPGSRQTGYGIVEGDGNRLCHVLNGTIRLSGDMDFPGRLKIIYEQLTSIIERCQPDCMAIENIFFAKNVKSALLLGHARGAAILAGVNSGLPVHEYSALQVKQAVAGYGKAGKDQVMQMIRYLFGLKEELNANATDALAVAICHINTGSSMVRWNVHGES